MLMKIQIVGKTRSDFKNGLASLIQDLLNNQIESSCNCPDNGEGFEIDYCFMDTENVFNCDSSIGVIDPPPPLTC